MSDNADLVTMSASDIDKLYDEIDALRARIADLEQTQRWIPVSERLPEIETFIMAYDGVNIWETLMDKDRNFYEPGFVDIVPVTHWMPLPQPPEDK